MGTSRSRTRAERFSPSVSSENLCLRVERRQVLEEDLLARPLRRLEVDGLHLDEREVSLAILRRPNLARHRVARVQIELAYLRGGDVDVVGAGQVVVVGGAEEAESVGQRLEHAFREDEAALLGAGLQDLEDELLFPHAGGARHIQLFGNLGECPDAHVLERRQLDAFKFFRRRGAIALRGLLILRLRRGCGWRLFACLSISFHGSSSPSSVTAQRDSTELLLADSKFSRHAGSANRRAACRCSTRQAGSPDALYQVGFNSQMELELGAGGLIESPSCACAFSRRPNS